MATTSITHQSGERGSAIEVFVPSFSRPDVHYTVRLYEGGSTCTCPAYTKGHKTPCKHASVAPSLLKIRALSFGVDRHEQRLLSLAKRLYSKPRKGETAAQSMDLTLEVDRERFATPALRRDSWARHGVVSQRCFGGEAA